MLRRIHLLAILAFCAGRLFAQDLQDIQVHGYATQGFLFSSNNNYLTMKSSSGSLAWTEGALSVSDSVSDNLRVGMQLHMYQMGELGGPTIKVDWASGDYRFNDHLGVRAGKIKTVIGLFNDSQDVDALFLWILLPQSTYPVDNRSLMLAELGGAVYGDLPLGAQAGNLKFFGHVGDAGLDLDEGYAKQFQDIGLNLTTAPHGIIYGGDLRWQAPLRGLTLGASGFEQAMDGTASNGTLHLPSNFTYANYARFQRGRWDFAVERWRVPAHPMITFQSFPVPFPLDERAWYVMASYRVSEKLQIGSYYSHFVNHAADLALPTSYSKDWVVSSRYNFNAYFYGKLEGHFLHGTGLGYYASDNPNGLQTNSKMLAARIGFSF